MRGTMPGKRRQGGQKKQWLDDITQWSGQSLVDMVRLAEDTEYDIDGSFMKSPTLVNRVLNSSMILHILYATKNQLHFECFHKSVDRI